MLGWLVDRDINPHIPVLDKAGRTDGTWSRAVFEWDPMNNQYICPEGAPLKQFRRNYCDPNCCPTGKGVAKYQALKTPAKPAHTGPSRTLQRMPAPWATIFCRLLGIRRTVAEDRFAAFRHASIRYESLTLGCAQQKTASTDCISVTTA